MTGKLLQPSLSHTHTNTAGSSDGVRALQLSTAAETHADADAAEAASSFFSLAFHIFSFQGPRKLPLIFTPHRGKCAT